MAKNFIKKLKKKFGLYKTPAERKMERERKELLKVRKRKLRTTYEEELHQARLKAAKVKAERVARAEIMPAARAPAGRAPKRGILEQFARFGEAFEKGMTEIPPALGGKPRAPKRAVRKAPKRKVKAPKPARAPRERFDILSAKMPKYDMPELFGKPKKERR